MADTEVHLRIAYRSYPAHAWATGLDADLYGGPGWQEYLEQTYQHVWAKDFWSKEIYLGVRLGLARPRLDGLLDRRRTRPDVSGWRVRSQGSPGV